MALSGAHGDEIIQEFLKFIRDQKDPDFPATIELVGDYVGSMAAALGDQGQSTYCMQRAKCSV